MVIAHNDIDADKYAFYGEWLDVMLRSLGLEPSKLTKRVKFHFVARLAALVEANFNFIELGPRGTGKSYFFSEFSPYSRSLSIEQIVNSTDHDLFLPLPQQFDLAVMDRFACYLPGWEMPKNSSPALTDRYGLITDYRA